MKKAVEGCREHVFAAHMKDIAELNEEIAGITAGEGSLRKETDKTIERIG